MGILDILPFKKQKKNKNNTSSTCNEKEVVNGEENEEEEEDEEEEVEEEIKMSPFKDYLLVIRKVRKVVIKLRNPNNMIIINRKKAKTPILDCPTR